MTLSANAHQTVRPFLLAAALVASAPLLPHVALRAQEAASALSLSQRRALKEYRETRFPELQKRLNEAAKFDVPLEVQWEAMADRGAGESYQNDDYFTNVYFVPLIEALKPITADAMGAAALKTKLKKVVLACDKDAASDGYDQTVKFKDGTLTIDWAPFTNPQDQQRRTQVLAAILDKIL